MFDVFNLLLREHRTAQQEQELRVDIEGISGKLDAQITHWYEFGCPFIPHNVAASFMLLRSRHEALYLHSMDALRRHRPHRENVHGS